MMNIYVKEANSIKLHLDNNSYNEEELPLWIDILNMTPEEEMQAEKILNLDIPSLEEMKNIEVSSRLYHKNNAIFMTSSLILKPEDADPEIQAITFVLYKNTLVTIRYCEPVPFINYAKNFHLMEREEYFADAIFCGLVESIIDRIAEILENIGAKADDTAKIIFRNKNNKSKTDFKDIIEKIGLKGDLVSKARESLISLGRMVSYAEQFPTRKISPDSADRLSIISKDITALSDHASFLSNKINFLLDSTLGMINIEQNNIIKIFSVASVISMPPTLVAGIYGMNFHNMPELSWKYGYPIAFSMMLFLAWLPYKIFKIKKWL
jgi:magnesium transporter